MLKDAQAQALNLTHWHQFLECLVGAGFRSGEMISSQNALLYAYAFYLIGRKRFESPSTSCRRPSAAGSSPRADGPLHELSRDRDGR